MPLTFSSSPYYTWCESCLRDMTGKTHVSANANYYCGQCWPVMAELYEEADEEVA